MKRVTRISFAFAFCLAIPIAPACSGQSSPTSDGDENRPHLNHQTAKLPDEKPLAPDDSILVPSSAEHTTLLVAPGLYLPTTGRVWALDEFEGKPELVHVKYSQVGVDNHNASNILKSEAAPLIYKPKKTIEIKGAASTVRLHDPSPTLFLRGLAEDQAESESNDSGGQSTLTLIRLESKGDRRVAATIAFTQITTKAARSQDTIDVITERLPGTNWWNIKPKQPLPPGEYGLMQLPKGQYLFGSVVYDFAIDLTAPEMKGSIKAGAELSP